jgi:hypothetical protein
MPSLGVPKPLGGVFDLPTPGSSDLPPACPMLPARLPLGGVFVPGIPREKSKGAMPVGILCDGGAPEGGALPTGKLTPGKGGMPVPPALPGGVNPEPPGRDGKNAGLGLLPSSGGLKASKGGGPNSTALGGGGGGSADGFLGATVGTAGVLAIFLFGCSASGPSSFLPTRLLLKAPPYKRLRISNFRSSTIIMTYGQRASCP